MDERERLSPEKGETKTKITEEMICAGAEVLAVRCLEMRSGTNYELFHAIAGAVLREALRSPL